MMSSKDVAIFGAAAIAGQIESSLLIPSEELFDESDLDGDDLEVRAGLLGGIRRDVGCHNDRLV